MAVAEGEFVTRREFEGTTKYISEKLDRIESKADSIHDELLDEIKGTREELKNEFNKRFDTLESRLDKLEGRFDSPGRPVRRIGRPVRYIGRPVR